MVSVFPGNPSEVMLGGVVISVGLFVGHVGFGEAVDALADEGEAAEERVFEAVGKAVGGELNFVQAVSPVRVLDRPVVVKAFTVIVDGCPVQFAGNAAGSSRRDMKFAVIVIIRIK